MTPHDPRDAGWGLDSGRASRNPVASRAPGFALRNAATPIATPIADCGWNEGAVPSLFIEGEWVSSALGAASPVA